MFVQEEKSTKTRCYHCGADCVDTHKYDAHAFCCNGCVAVYQLLSDHNLSDFYDLNEKKGKAPEYTGDFDWLKEIEVQESLYSFHEGNTANLRVHLPEIHCSACIYLLENLRKVHKGILDVEVNFTQKKARIFFKTNEISLYELALLLQKIGYKPYFSSDREKQKSKTGNLVKKLTVAGFFFGNIMLLSFPEYLGGHQLEDQFGQFFGWMMLLLSLPVLFYSANTYLISAFKSIRFKTLNLDIPIALGILVLFGRSAYEVISHTGAGYFDSFTGFVFFLLVGRWFQNKTYEFIDFDKDVKSHLPLAIQVVTNGGAKYTPIDRLRKGQTVLLKNNEIIPTDSVLASGSSEFDFSFITGESHPVEKQQGDKIYAGAKNLGTKTYLKITSDVDHSYLSGLWKGRSAADKRKVWRERDHQLTRLFLLVLGFITVASGLVWWWLDASSVFLVITSVLIIACPCALALSAPFTFGNMQRIMGRKGMYLKDSYDLPEISQVTDLVFDKTGTLTTNAYEVTYEGINLTEEEIIAVKTLCDESGHPYSKAIASFYNDVLPKEIQSFNETPGKGVQGKVFGIQIELKAYRKKSSASQLIIDGEEKGVFYFTSHIDEQVVKVLQELKGRYCLHLLSGDGDKDFDIFKTLIPEENIHFNQSPYQKERYIQNLKEKGTVAMFGDGINDTAALQHADIGIAITDHDHQFTPAADVILQRNSIPHLKQFLDYSQQSTKILVVLYVFSLIYNVVGLSFAVTNQLTPLVAAIIMPLSSITVVLMATFLSQVKGRGGVFDV